MPSLAQVQSIRLDRLRRENTDINWGEFLGVAGREQYRLLGQLSTQFQNREIFDVRTHTGASALALSQNPNNTVHSFDTEHKYRLAQVPNIQQHLEDLWNPEIRARQEERLLNSPFIFLDIDPHEGTRELEFCEWLRAKDYKGFVICDDIWYFKPMRDAFWYKIPAEHRLDITEMGHWSGTGVVRFHPSDLWPATQTPENWTVVTAYFDLTKMEDASKPIKDRPATHQLSNANATMATDQNLVVFCEPETVETLRALRPAHLQHKVKFYPMSFEDFPMTQYRAKIQQNRRDKPYHFDERNTASYYLFCMSRQAMLKQIIAENPFQSTHFAWLNVCIERMGWKNLPALDRVWAAQRDKFSTCYIDYIPKSLVDNEDEQWKWGRCSLCSGFFTGKAEFMKAFCDAIEDKFLYYLERKRGHADETLYSPVFFENREIFDVYQGDYTEMITNQVEPRERTFEPVRLLISRSFAAGDYAVCEKACDTVWTAYKKGVTDLNSGQLAEFIAKYRDLRERLGKGTGLP